MPDNERGTRNLRLDLVKGVTCFLIVFLHNTILSEGGHISNGYDVVVVYLHTITRVGVPAFMGISGYFLFFEKDRPFEYGWKRIGRYLVVLLVWLFIYNAYGFFTASSGGSDLKQYIKELDFTGAHLWYLKLYVLILAVFPIVNCIVKNRRVLRIYIIFWLVFFSVRFTIGIAASVIPALSKMLSLFQLPFFEYEGYIGGTLGSEKPTSFMGLFVVIGAFIALLEKNKITEKRKALIFIAIIGYLLAATATVLLGIKTGEYHDYFFQPVELPVIFMTMGYLILFYCIPENFLKKNVNRIERLSDFSLGVYIMHPLVGSILWSLPLYNNMISGLNIILGNFINWVIISIICLGLVALIKSILPKKVSRYIV